MVRRKVWHDGKCNFGLLLVPTFLWCQHLSGVSICPALAFFRCQPFSGASFTLMPAFPLVISISTVPVFFGFQQSPGVGSLLVTAFLRCRCMLVKNECYHQMRTALLLALAQLISQPTRDQLVKMYVQYKLPLKVHSRFQGSQSPHNILLRLPLQPHCHGHIRFPLIYGLFNLIRSEAYLNHRSINVATVASHTLEK